MDRRKSLLYCGAEEDDVLALREHDETFYGFRSASDSDDSCDSESSDDGHGAKRLDAGSDSSSDELFSEGEDLAATGVSSCLRGENADEVRAGLVHAQVRDNRSLGCGCSINHWLRFSSDAVEKLMMNLAAMTKSARKQYIMGELAACTNLCTQVRSTVSYTILGEYVCRGVFLEVHAVSEIQLRRLRACVVEQQTQPPVHGSTGHRSPNQLPQEAVEKIVQFLKHFASCHGIPQPAAPRGRGKPAPIFLPAHYTKKKIHKLYLELDGSVHVECDSVIDTNI